MERRPRCCGFYVKRLLLQIIHTKLKAATDFPEKGGEVQSDVWELTLGLTSATLTRMKTIINWLKAYEFIAIWLEGIALVAIFIWDRLDGRKQHEETLAQLQVSQKQLEASLEQVEASHKPFVAFSTERRNPEDALLSIGGAVGGVIV